MEESNADKAIKALTAALAPKARVKRNGKVESVEAKELVPGDIVIIQFGNIVPADVKLLGKSGSDEVPMQVSTSCLRAASPDSRSLPDNVLCAETSPGTDAFFSLNKLPAGAKVALIHGCDGCFCWTCTAGSACP